VHVYADDNNDGSSVTTLNRAGARFDYGNLITSGDKLSLIGVMGFPPKHLYFTNAIYSVHLNGQGTRMDLSYLYSHFDVQRLESLDLEGRSQIGGIRFNQALARTRRFSTDLFVGFDIKQLRNFVLDEKDSYDKLRVLTAGGKVDYIDSAKGRNIFDAFVSIGIPDILGGLKAVDSQCSREGAGGRFYILNLDYKRVQQLPLDCFLLLNASGQGTFNKLPIPEQIYIGGIDTVRGYPLATALGDNGYYGNVELRVPPPFLSHRKVPFMKKEWKDFLQFVGFVDHGGVYTNGKVVSEDSTVYLTSAGAGLRVFGPWNIDVSFDAGFPLSHPHKSSNCILYVKVSMKIF
jgi:hemolysin activation/secretion protein